MEEQSKDVLRRAMSLWWLRPENGLALASYTLNGVSLLPEEGTVTADYACGDGINTFFKCGGVFDSSFDLFLGSINRDSQVNIVAKKIDVFDSFEESYNPIILKQPSCKYTYGTDHKLNLLKKAERLSFYHNLIHSDLMEDTVIPDSTIEMAYCNSLYWVADTQKALMWISAKVNDGGKIVLDVFTKNKYLLDFTKMFPTMDPKWAELINRGRMDNNPGLKLPRDWEKMFHQMGLTIVEKRNIFPAAMMKIWNIGLRPIFPLIQKMQGVLDQKNRLEIKTEWVETITDLLLPVLEYPEEFSKDKTEYRIQYVLEKKRSF